MYNNQYYTIFWFLFFFNDPATPEIYTLSLHDALPICADTAWAVPVEAGISPTSGTSACEPGPNSGAKSGSVNTARVLRRISSCSSAGRACVGSARNRCATMSRSAIGNSGRLCSSRWTRSPRLKRSRPATASGDRAGGSAPLGRDGASGFGGSGSEGGGSLTQFGSNRPARPASAERSQTGGALCGPASLSPSPDHPSPPISAVASKANGAAIPARPVRQSVCQQISFAGSRVCQPQI